MDHVFVQSARKGNSCRVVSSALRDLHLVGLCGMTTLEPYILNPKPCGEGSTLLRELGKRSLFVHLDSFSLSIVSCSI